MSLQPGDGIAAETSPAVRPAATEFAAGAVFLVMALIAAWSLWTDPYLSSGQVGDDPGPAFVPWIGTCVIGFGGLAQMVWTILRAHKAGGLTRVGEFVPAKLVVPCALVVLLILYRIGMSSLGFVVASVLFAIPTIAILHWRSGGVFNARYLVQLPIEAALIVAGIYLVFSYGIHVPFP